VPLVYTTTGQSYPYYLNPNYIAFQSNLITNLGVFVRSLPKNLLETIAFYQVGTGSTGDEVPYKGNPTNAIYNISDTQWQNFRVATFNQYFLALDSGQYSFAPNSANSPIRLLFNNIDPGASGYPLAYAWVSSNLVTGYGVKFGGAAAGIS
jgi:hypothetical protein